MQCLMRLVTAFFLRRAEARGLFTQNMIQLLHAFHLACNEDCSRSLDTAELEKEERQNLIDRKRPRSDSGIESGNTDW